jgi:hypothetical protein
MSQLYVPDKSWLVCSDGMSMQQLKVTSQTTIKIAGGKLAATIKDRTGCNFVCGKMLVAGAILGAAIAALFVSTGGLVFFAAAAVIAGSAVGGAVSGAAAGTLLGMIPCFCALFTMPYSWIGCHPNVLFEKKQALLENATLICLLGGKIEIHIFKEFANVRLSEIRKNILIEAGVQALKTTIFLRFPKTFIFGNVVADIALHFYTGSKADKLKEGKFAFDSPNSALKISDAKTGSHLLSNNASRFQTALSNGFDDDDRTLSDWKGNQSKLLEYRDEEGKQEGTQGNAFRHALWQAEIKNEFGNNTATRVGNVHEKDSNIEYKQEGFDTLEETDSYIDQQNNVIGRMIGEQNPDAPRNVLAEKVLDYYYENGLWEAEKIDGKYFAVQTKLPEDQYNELKQAVATMNRYGYLENALENKLTELGLSKEMIDWFKIIPKTDY